MKQPHWRFIGEVDLIQIFQSTENSGVYRLITGTDCVDLVAGKIFLLSDQPGTGAVKLVEALEPVLIKHRMMSIAELDYSVFVTDCLQAFEKVLRRRIRRAVV